MAAKRDHRVRITESLNQDGGKIPTYHTVHVGSDEDGWVELPFVTDVDLPLRQGEIRRAKITVIYPQVQFEGRGYPNGS